VRRTTPCNNKVGACAHCVRSGETARPAASRRQPLERYTALSEGRLQMGPDRRSCRARGGLTCGAQSIGMPHGSFDPSRFGSARYVSRAKVPRPGISTAAKHITKVRTV